MAKTNVQELLPLIDQLDSDKTHPHWAEYETYASVMQRESTHCPIFAHWCIQRERQIIAKQAAQHPQYATYQASSESAKGGFWTWLAAQS